MNAAKRLLLEVKRRLGEPYRDLQRRAEHLLFERGLQSTDSHGVSSGHLFLYRALLGRRVARSDVFLDYGCGRGRVLLHAARLPFARVIGLDLDESAVAVATANAEVLARRAPARKIEVLREDATSWQVPDEVTHIYMFNPFWDEVFEAMLERVCESLRRRPRKLILIYAYPRCAEAVLATGRFRRVRSSRGLRRDKPQHRIDIFEALAT